MGRGRYRLRSFRRYPWLPAACSVCLFAPVPAHADMVELKTGRFYECIIAQETADTYGIELEKRSIRLPKTKVAEVYRWSDARNAKLRESWATGRDLEPAPPRRPAGAASADGETQVVTADTFDRMVLRAREPVLVDFWATWCGPCHRQAPILEALAAEFAGRVTIVKLDVDEHPAIPHKYGITAYPTLLLFKDGKVQLKLVGVQSPGVLRSAFNRVGV